MHKMFIAATIAFLVSCSATDTKRAVSFGAAASELACRDAIALGVSSPELVAVCRGVDVLAPVVQAIVAARSNPTEVKARYAMEVRPTWATDAGADASDAGK